jgi:hypothetical protein
MLSLLPYRQEEMIKRRVPVTSCFLEIRKMVISVNWLELFNPVEVNELTTY